MAITKIYKGNIVRDDIVKIYKGNELIYEAVSSETWLINEKPQIDTGILYFSFNVNFTSNNESFNVFKTDYASNYGSSLYFGNIEVYTYSAGPPLSSWSNQAYRTVTFETAPTGDLLTWLQANAVKQ